MTTHATLIRQPDGSACLFTPYDADFVDELKACIPVRLRRWDPDDKCWVFTGNGIAQAISLARSYYGRVEDVPADPPSEDSVTALASPHAVLCLTPDAPTELICAAYRILAKRHHPDRGGDTRTMQRINLAYQRLCGKRGAA